MGAGALSGGRYAGPIERKEAMEKGKRTVGIVLPTLNEIEGLKWFMPRLKKEWYDELLIVDGGSTDGTLEYCRQYGYPYFVQSGKGLANANNEAFARTKADILVEATPDGNSLPELIPSLIAKMDEGYDMVVVSRYLPPAKSYDDDPVTAFGNRMFTFFINVLFKAHYTDTLVGFRAWRREAILKMSLHDQFEQTWLKSRCMYMNCWDPASSIRAAALKLKTAEIAGDEPVRIGGARKLSIVRNGFGILLEIFHEFFLGPGFYTRPERPYAKKAG